MMMPGRTVACLIVLLIFTSACERLKRGLVISCIGDSITAGVTRGGLGLSSALYDPLGGYPGRLQREIGNGVQVLNRGLPGATTAWWLADPTTFDGQIFWAVQNKARWSDFALRELPASAPSDLTTVLAADRPNLLVILLGINDLIGLMDSGAPKLADLAGARLDEIVREAQTIVPIVLIATTLPNRRDPPELRERLNAHIRAAHPDFLPLGERFAAAGWQNLLGDLVHPNEEGYQVLAEILAEEFRARGYVRRSSATGVGAPGRANSSVSS